jgi:putative FmdB family regulatory protein
MPLYEWDCPLCGKPSESLSKPHEPVVCPHRGCTELTRKVSLTSPHVWTGDSSGAEPKGKGK